MPLQIVQGDITKMRVDAIVNAANASLLGGGGVDGCIHRAAGPQLLAECKTLGGCRTGSAKITGAGNLPCRYVIHAVGPRWQGGHAGEARLLASCYRTALYLAQGRRCCAVAFPLISSGAYGYPKEGALRVAVETIRAFLMENDMLVYLVIFDKSAYQIDRVLLDDITRYISEQYAEDAAAPSAGLTAEPRSFSARPQLRSEPVAPVHISSLSALPASLLDSLKQKDESFSESLMRRIRDSGMTDAECYRRANIDRKLFSKIRSRRDYHPSRETAVAFAVALRLSFEDTEDLLRKAGYALSRSDEFDIIVSYCITHGIYDVYRINEVLFQFDQTLLGVS